MKKLLSVVVLVFFLHQVFALSSDIKESYLPRETAIAQLMGSVLEPVNSQQMILKNSNLEVPFDHGISKLGEKYYLWFVNPLDPGNYTLIIERILTDVNGNLEYKDYEQKFIVQGNITDYSVKPGAIYSKKDFEIYVNLYQESEKTITLDFPFERSFNLKNGQNKIYFSIKDLVGIKSDKIRIGKYDVPVYLIGNLSTQTQNYTLNESTTNSTIIEVEKINQTNETTQIKGFNVDPSFILSTVLAKNNSNYSYSFEISNFEYKEINVRFGYDPNKFLLNPNKNVSIEGNASKRFEITIKNLTGKFLRDAVIIYVGNESKSLILELNITKEDAEIQTSYLRNSTKESLYYCSELNGKKCNSDEACSGNEILSLDGSCCVGSCATINEKSKSWIGYLIAAVVILALLLVYLKYKKGGNVKPLVVK
ncbi:MAG: hypothetical protein AABY05_00445 [Nanoarchaeota archaeon]